MDQPAGAKNVGSRSGQHRITLRFDERTGVRNARKRQDCRTLADFHSSL
jgi:hypothetical protein